MPYFNVNDAFNSLDINGDGRISRDEFRRMIQSRGFYVSEKEVSEIVEKMDKTKDGRVSFHEVSSTHLLPTPSPDTNLLLTFSSQTRSDQEAHKDTPEQYVDKSKYI